MEIIKIDSDDYPRRLKEVKNAPKVIYAEGNKELLNKVIIAVVGSRKCTKYGEEQAKRFSSYLSSENFTIASGLAFGIDSVAHINSMENEGRTIAVIASGFDHIYPKENRQLFESILNNNGLVISEYPPDTEVDMHKFPKRNRIIAGISMATIVIEARFRSGSTITAHETFKQGKEVFCIPGDVDRKESAGTNALLMEGANLVTSPYQIESYFRNNDEKDEELESDKESMKVYRTLGLIPISINEIVKKSELPIQKVMEILFILETEEKIIQLPGNQYKVNK